MPIRGIVIVAGIIGLLNVNAAFAEALPEFLLDDLAPLMDASSTTTIDPGVYELSRANQAYADEIACILVKFFGQAEEIQANMVAVVDDAEQKAAVEESIISCLEAGESGPVGGYGSAKDTFNQGITQGM
jgi:hypothetical protein